VPISDAQFRLGAIGGAVLLALGVAGWRFCGSVDLPPKPNMPTGVASGTSSQLLEEANSSPVIYQDYLAKDATAAGVHVPTYEEMSRKFPHRFDEGRRVLEVGDPAIEIAGLRLVTRRSGNSLVLEVENVTRSDLAYLVVTEPTPNIAGCTRVAPLSFNAIVIARGQREARVECVWRAGMALAVLRVETVEVAGLSSWYLNQLSPAELGLDERTARGHRQPKTKERCSSYVSQTVRAGLERGQIGWHDLVDFYARHRCQTYSFPSSYRAFSADGQRKIPAI
jgi:hypothetical protein